MVLRLAIKGGSTEATSLRMLHYKKATDTFSKKTGIDVEIVMGADNDLAYRTQIKNGELKADVELIDSLWIPELAESLEPLDSFVKGWEDWAQYHERAKGLGEYGGHIYGIPHEMDVRGIFYNKDMVKEEWSPKSLSEILDKSEDLKAPLQLYYGTKEGETAMCECVLPILYAFGGEIYNGKWNIKGKAMLMTLRYYYEAFISRSLCSRISSAEARELFASGKIGILFDGMWCWDEFWGKEGKFPVEDREKKIRFVSVPGINGPVNLFAGWVFSVASASQEAKELLKELCSEEITERICTSTAHVAPRKDVIESSAYSKDPFLVECTRMLDNCFFRPKAKEYSLISYQILRATEMVVDGMRPRKALRKLSKSVNELLREP